MAVTTTQVSQGALILKKPVVIANTAQNSEVISLAGASVVGIQTPASLTGTALTFLSCDDADGTNPVQVRSTVSGTALSYTVASSLYYAIDPAPFAGIQFLMIRSGTAETGAKTLLVSLKGI